MWGGNRGGRTSNSWQHNPQHRGGAPYADRSTANRFGGTSRDSGGVGNGRAQNQRASQTGAGNRGGAGGGAGNVGANRGGAGASSLDANRGGGAGGRAGGGAG